MGTLYIVATPIGNLEDISLRALRILFSSDIIACEDTRRTGILLTELRKRYGGLLDIDATPQLVRYDEHSEQNASPELVSKLLEGKSVSLVSDAGTPLISDPGFILLREAKKHGVPVISVPGPTAVMTALAASGLPADHVLFLGFPPEKAGHRVRQLESIRQTAEDKSLFSVAAWYIAPHKLQSMLSDIERTLPNNTVTLARELTKIHETYESGTASELLVNHPEPKGEYVVLLSLK